MCISWETEGAKIEPSAIEELLYRNPLIDDFIKKSDKFFIAANKGMGKTIILKLKRFNLELKQNKQRNNDKSDKDGILIIPQNKSYLDSITRDFQLPSNTLTKLEKIEFSKNIWGLSLRLSILTNFNNEMFNQKVIPIFKKYGMKYDYLEEWSNATPCDIFSSLLSLESPSKIEQFFRESLSMIEGLFSRIHSGIYVFIDMIDEGLVSFPQKAWISVQTGLLEAAWNLNNNNPHCKIFTSIRQEAFGNYLSPLRPNLEASILCISYNKNEIFELLNNLTLYYEDKKFIDFLGHDKIKLNGNFNDIEENSYNYLYRHGIGRPRDYVIMLQGISEQKKINKDNCLSQDELKHIINQKSENNIIPNIFSEVKMFLNCITQDNIKNSIFNQINFNIITISEMIEIWKDINEYKENITFDEIVNVFNNANFKHPFSDLYIAGLLGYLKEDIKTGGNIQRFKQPSDITDFSSYNLPISDLYFLHPALGNIIRKSHKSTSYNLFKYSPIGHKIKWDNIYSLLFEIQRIIQKIKNVLMFNKLIEDIDKIIKNLLANNFQNNNFDAILIQLKDLYSRIKKLKEDDNNNILKYDSEFNLMNTILQKLYNVNDIKKSLLSKARLDLNEIK